MKVHQRHGSLKKNAGLKTVLLPTHSFTSLVSSYMCKSCWQWYVARCNINRLTLNPTEISPLLFAFSSPSSLSCFFCKSYLKGKLSLVLPGIRKCCPRDIWIWQWKIYQVDGCVPGRVAPVGRGWSFLLIQMIQIPWTSSSLTVAATLPCLLNEQARRLTGGWRRIGGSQDTSRWCEWRKKAPRCSPKSLGNHSGPETEKMISLINNSFTATVLLCLQFIIFIYICY